MNGVVVYAGKFCCVVNKADFNCCWIVDVGNVDWVKFGCVKADLFGTITVEIGGAGAGVGAGAGAAWIEDAALKTVYSCGSGGLFFSNWATKSINLES